MYSYRLYKYRDSYVMYIPTVHTFGSVFFTHTLLVQTHTHYVSAPWLLLVVWGVVLWGQVYHLCLLEVVFWLRLRKCWIMLQRTLMEISESKPFWSRHCCQEVLSSWKLVEIILHLVVLLVSSFWVWILLPWIPHTASGLQDVMDGLYLILW